ncbi:flavodoxin [Candidatus Soleaferrea massiliensis]|uniref:flavodoxin n=1 Tax=Candidatus Soleaferrea massiliensis TaxID=1470354 RepID=UPI00058FB7D8|nr:flavodoxin [Candidatus Soleaferrea massiliensis]
MKQIAVVYWSGTGNTASMARFVADGIKEAGAEAQLFTASEFTPDMVKEYSRIAFGCSSMGAEELEESEFEPMFASVEDDLKGKKIVLFGSYGWGDGEWMRSWEERVIADGVTLAADFVIANEAPDDEAAKECRKLGAALAKA